MTMSQAAIIADVKASLNDSAALFKAANDADFIRHLDVALQDIAASVACPRFASVDLLTDQIDGWPGAYPAPADYSRFGQMIWGKHSYQPWDALYPGQLPSIIKADINGMTALMLCPAASPQQIAVCGSQFKFSYIAKPAVGVDAANTTLPERHRGLLILRMQAEAMRELTMRNITKPTAMRDGLTGTPRNSTPAALYQALMAEFQAKAATL
ncbi:hypothetical protein [Deefgea piscis]|uniref:hypothetical protein n=1 Tax=Deefgea piscis TaxID=2739061 RepID=UPI001C7FDF04|nr:hypothetical protein [Deefgea piscis]QZA80857.1 hypothetical protein K4H25_15405 [Deefgea piscis]